MRQNRKATKGRMLYPGVMLMGDYLVLDPATRAVGFSEDSEPFVAADHLPPVSVDNPVEHPPKTGTKRIRSSV